MITIIALSLFLFTITLSLGGGIYEVLVIYPNWKHDVTPANLLAKLQSSGQLNANKRFWPLVSPLQGLLAIVSIILAIKFTGEAQSYWLTAAILIFVNRLITFGYFVPEMLRKIMKPEQIETTRLQAIVRRWTALSPLRIIPELLAWGLIVAALVHLK
jgi:hypothetical protein